MVFISIDQMRRDYITRYGAHWTGGLRRLVDEGALFVQAAYPYFNTVTCAGHATMGDGRLSVDARHGAERVVGSRRGARGRLHGRRSVPGHRLPHAGPEERRRTARACCAPTPSPTSCAGRRRARRTSSRSSMKPRSAIMLAGHKGDACCGSAAAAGFTTLHGVHRKQIPFVEAFVAKRIRSRATSRRHGRSCCPRRLPRTRTTARARTRRRMDQDVPASDSRRIRRTGPARRAGRRRRVADAYLGTLRDRRGRRVEAGTDAGHRLSRRSASRCWTRSATPSVRAATKCRTRSCASIATIGDLLDGARRQGRRRPLRRRADGRSWRRADSGADEGDGRRSGPRRSEGA